MDPWIQCCRLTGLTLPAAEIEHAFARQLSTLRKQLPASVSADARGLVRAVERELTRDRHSPQVPAVLHFALVRISELLELAWAAAWVFSEEQEVWKIVASLGLTPAGAAITFSRGSALPCRVGERGTPVMVNDLDRCEFHRSVEEHFRMRSALYAPIKIGSRTVGVFAVYSDRKNCYSTHDLELLSAIGEHLGMLVAYTIMDDRAGRIAVLEERDRHARDLHDGVHQALVSLKIYAAEARAALLEGDTVAAAEILDQCIATADEAAEELSASIASLRERHEPLGDVYAVAARLKRRLMAAGIDVRLRLAKLSLDPPTSDALAWICREATSNILKHSSATRVTFDLRAAADGAVLRVCDDGVGLPQTGRRTASRMHIGLQVMRERAEEIGAELTVSSAERGVSVQCRVPGPALAFEPPGKRRGL
jgi:signal transduction histidine kinase